MDKKEIFTKLGRDISYYFDYIPGDKPIPQNICDSRHFRSDDYHGKEIIEANTKQNRHLERLGNLILKERSINERMLSKIEDVTTTPPVVIDHDTNEVFIGGVENGKYVNNTLYTQTIIDEYRYYRDLYDDWV